MGDLKDLIEAVVRRLTRKGYLAAAVPGGLVVNGQLIKLAVSHSFGVAVGDSIIVDCDPTDDWAVERVVSLIKFALA